MNDHSAPAPEATPAAAATDESFAALTARLEAEAGRPWWKIANEEYWFEQGKRIGAGKGADLQPLIDETKRKHRDLEANLASAATARTDRERRQLASEATRAPLTQARGDALRHASTGCFGYDKTTRRFIPVKGAVLMPSSRTLWWLFDNGFIDINYDVEKAAWGANKTHHPVILTTRGNASVSDR